MNAVATSDGSISASAKAAAGKVFPDWRHGEIAIVTKRPYCPRFWTAEASLTRAY